jgi:hypothetical protein
MIMNLHTVGRTILGCSGERRTSTRNGLAVPGRIVWRDSQGTLRFSSIVTRDVSDSGALVDCLSGPPIPVHRLVHVQLDRSMRGFESLPVPLRQGKVLAAVYRVGQTSRVTGLPDGYALRLLVEPARHATSMPSPFVAAERSLALPA